MGKDSWIISRLFLQIDDSEDSLVSFYSFPTLSDDRSSSQWEKAPLWSPVLDCQCGQAQVQEEEAGILSHLAVSFVLAALQVLCLQVFILFLKESHSKLASWLLS